MSTLKKWMRWFVVAYVICLSCVFLYELSDSGLITPTSLSIGESSILEDRKKLLDFSGSIIINKPFDLKSFERAALEKNGFRVYKSSRSWVVYTPTAIFPPKSTGGTWSLTIQYDNTGAKVRCVKFRDVDSGYTPDSAPADRGICAAVRPL